MAFAASCWGLNHFLRKTILYGISPLVLVFFTLALSTISLFLVFKPSFRELWSELCLDFWGYTGLTLSGSVLGVFFSVLCS